MVHLLKARSHMAKSSNELETDEPRKSTALVRVFSDIAEKMAWIYKVEGVASANLLDPLVRGSINARYKKIEHIVEQMKQAEAAARKHRSGE